jgi:formimidoylglutamate deiminase
METTAFLPDLLLSGGRVLEGAALVVRGGAVESVGAPPEGAAIVRLAGRAIAPGLVSAHSHAFQRAIRGRTEHRTQGRDDFWSWREAMYAAAQRLDPEDLYAVSRFCFAEMAASGITAVGEFHYLHRDPAGQPYADPNELDLAVARAARDTGLRLVLLRVAYARAGFGAPENPRQKRFIEGSPDEYLRNLDALARALAPDPLASVGAAPHSVRACPAHWLEPIAREAARRGWPLHLHVSEQPGEVAQCRAEHGVSPPLLLEKLGALTAATTAVHAVHLDSGDIAALGRARATVCACPTTERNLGDGVVRADLLLAAGARLSLGTDSNVQLSLLEDARELEYHLRLLELRRAVLDTGEGLGAPLYGIASEGGMRSLGLPGGALRPGEPADFLVADLDDPSIAGASADDFAALAVFSMERTAIRAVHVAGQPISLDTRAALPAFRAALRRLWS